MRHAKPNGHHLQYWVHGWEAGLARTGSPRSPTDQTVGDRDDPARSRIDLQATTLLLVGDDLGDQRLFEEQLRGAGLRSRVVTAGSAAEALDILDTQDEVDLVLLDLDLPDSQGLATIDRVTAGADGIPVIVLTGQADDPELAVSALRRGAHDHLVKGRSGSSELVRAIRYAIERHDLQRRSSAQLLHQAALHQLEIASTTTADLQAFAQSAASALRVGLSARRVTIRLAAVSLSGPVLAAATEPSVDDEPHPADDGDEVTEVALTGAGGDLGSLMVAMPSDEPLTTDQRRFLTTATASIVARVERIAASTALTARTRQLGTVQRVAEQLQRTQDPESAVATVASELATGAHLTGRGGVHVDVDGHTVDAGATDSSPQTVLEAPVTVRGEDLGVVQLLRHDGAPWGPEERTMLDGVTAQLSTWWALSRADQEHRRDLDRIVQLMETAPVGLALVGADGRIQFANDAALDLVGAADVEQFPWQFDDAGKAALDTTLSAIADVRRTGSTVRDVKVGLQQPDGTERVLSVNASPLTPSPAGRGMAISMSDVTTERRRAVLLETALDREQQSAEELRRVGELKDGFLRAVSHELRTPLASIFGFTETLRDHGRDLDGDQQRGMLDRLHINAQRLALLLEDLLDVGRLTAGVRSAPHRREVDLAELVGAIIDLLPPEGRTIEVDLEPTVAHVEPTKVERIVHNLLGNVVRHTPAGTTARVRTRRDGDVAILVVEDDGPGIPATEREQMFEPFVQGPHASTAASPGTGVGLSLVRQFVDLHGGTVEVDEAPSGGARFTVSFPDP